MTEAGSINSLCETLRGRFSDGKLNSNFNLCRLQKKVFFNNVGFGRYVKCGVLDKNTRHLIEIPKLHNIIDRTMTALGSVSLYESLASPPTSLDMILARQEAVREIESDSTIREELTSYVKKFSKDEHSLFRFMNDDFGVFNQYGLFAKVRKIGKGITKGLPSPKSSYLNDLINEISGFTNSDLYKMMAGPIYRTFKGIKPRRHMVFNGIPYIRRHFLPTVISFSLLAGLMYGVETGFIERSDTATVIVSGIFALCCGTPIMDMYFKPSNDRYKVIDPFRRKMLKDKHFISTLSAIGRIDELLSLVKYKENSIHPMTMPKNSESKTHYFHVKGMRNPILAINNPDFVANDICLNKSLTGITGPNSGGKTTTCKTIEQLQVMFQIGSYIPATYAEMSNADRISYQAPAFDSLTDIDGRFGTEMKMTKEIFFSTTPRSLVIFDELGEGTTYEEKVDYSRKVLEKFYLIGNNTILVTHNHELVSDFQREGKGQFLQTEFDGDKPTYRLIEGISRLSHSASVMEKNNFTEADMDRYLVENGYI